MTTFGLRPDDVVTDTKGNVLDGAAVKLYASQDDASNQINLLGTAYTDPKGRWTFSTDLALVWARTANGLIWRVDSDEEDHGQLSGLLDDDHPQYALADGSRGSFLTQAQADTLYESIGGGGGVTDQHIIDTIYTALTQGRKIKVSHPGGDETLIQLDYWFAPIFWGEWDTLGAYSTEGGDAFVTWSGALYKLLAASSTGEQPDLFPAVWQVIETFGGGGTGLPAGGTSGQVLTKASATDGDATWQTPSTGVTDHGALTGLADDDHPQYALADGTRGTFEVAGAVAAHSADTTAIHGIADTSKLVSSATVTTIWTGTQAAYDALTPSADTLYFITG